MNRLTEKIIYRVIDSVIVIVSITVQKKSQKTFSSICEWQFVFQRTVYAENTNPVSLKDRTYLLVCWICTLITCFLSRESGRLWRPFELQELCWFLGGSRHRQLRLRAEMQLEAEAHRLHQSQLLRRLDQLCKPPNLSLTHLRDWRLKNYNC